MMVTAISAIPQADCCTPATALHELASITTLVEGYSLISAEESVGMHIVFMMEAIPALKERISWDSHG